MFHRRCIEIAEKTRYMECCSSTLDFDCSFGDALSLGEQGPLIGRPASLMAFWVAGPAIRVEFLLVRWFCIAWHSFVA